MSNVAATYFSCEGPVRGECGMKHRSAAAAAAHIAKDDYGIKRYYGQNSYCDRRVVQCEADGCSVYVPDEGDWD